VDRSVLGHLALPAQAEALDHVAGGVQQQAQLAADGDELLALLDAGAGLVGAVAV
jgi:hypothetical protein